MLVRKAVSIGGLAALLALPASAPAQSTPEGALETRESYLARLRDVCAPGCQQPRDALRSARRQGGRRTGDIAAILDIRNVSRDGDRVRLHTMAEVNADYFDMQQFDFGMPQTDSRPLASANDIIVALDAEAVADLFAFPAVSESAKGGEVAAGAEGDIVVEGQRARKTRRPTLAEITNLLRGRRVAVRGQAVLTPVFVGARRDFRRKRLTIELASAEDLVILPRYDDNGEPILDGPLAGLAAP